METINYARESGYLAGKLSSLAFTLASQGLVKYDDYEKVKQICDNAIRDARASAQEVSSQ